MKPAPVLAGNNAGVAAALDALRAGAAIGMPTETVYGLAADGTDARAVAGIYAIKRRPQFNPLIAHVADVEMAGHEGVLDERATALADRFWPGPLTLVVPAASSGHCCELARAGLKTIALRAPDHPLAQALISGLGRPLAAPSANPSGRLSATDPQAVAAELGAAVALVLDGGRCRAGIESTIVALLPGRAPALLRPGAITAESLTALLGPLDSATGSEITAPGQLESHYAPRARLRLEAQRARAGETLLAFGSGGPPGAANLSPAGDLTEAAANLYRLLRELDTGEAATIAVMPVPADGLGAAINDRLQRAAAPRPQDARA